MKKLNPDILIGLSIASLFWVGVFVWQSSQPPPYNHPESHACEGTKSECAKATSYERIADYTWWLAVLTAVLAAVSAGQGYFLLQADKTARIAAEAAKKSVETAQAEFIAAHRPQIRVRNIVVNQPQSADGRKFPPFTPGHPISGQLFVVNVGGSRADILDGHCTVFWTRVGTASHASPLRGTRRQSAGACVALFSRGQSTFALFRSESILPAEVFRIAGNEIGS